MVTALNNSSTSTHLTHCHSLFANLPPYPTLPYPTVFAFSAFAFRHLQIIFIAFPGSKQFPVPVPVYGLKASQPATGRHSIKPGLEHGLEPEPVLALETLMSRDTAISHDFSHDRGNYLMALHLPSTSIHRRHRGASSRPSHRVGYPNSSSSCSSSSCSSFSILRLLDSSSPWPVVN